MAFSHYTMAWFFISLMPRLILVTFVVQTHWVETTTSLKTFFSFFSISISILRNWEVYTWVYFRDRDQVWYCQSSGRRSIAALTSLYRKKHLGLGVLLVIQWRTGTWSTVAATRVLYRNKFGKIWITDLEPTPFSHPCWRQLQRKIWFAGRTQSSVCAIIKCSDFLHTAMEHCNNQLYQSASGMSDSIHTWFVLFRDGA